MPFLCLSEGAQNILLIDRRDNGEIWNIGNFAEMGGVLV